MGIWYDKKAYELLKKCSDAKDLSEWNEYRKANNYAPINLRFANLHNFYLQKAELQNVDLRGSVSIGNSNFELANLDDTKFLLINYHKLSFLFFLWIGFFLFFFFEINIEATATFLLFTVLFSVINTVAILLLLLIANMQGSRIFFIKIAFIIITSINGILLGAIIADANQIFKTINLIIKNYNNDFLSFITILFVSLMIIVSIRLTLIAIEREEKASKRVVKSIVLALNPEKASGVDRKYLDDKMKSVVQELQKEATELNKSIELTHDDNEKEKLLHRLEKLEEKIQFYDAQEEKANLQKTQIENVIGELQAPYKYIHQTITKIEWHNRFYYGAILVFVGIFIYAITHGYIDQKIVTFSSLFTKETLPTFGTIFGVILFYGSPVLIGISLIIYFITQINKNIDKITELQEQERNIKQIASTIKAKAQIGMSDEEFVKETKNLIQKYQEGMMAGMFTKEKISDKEDKSSLLTYREKMIDNGMSKLLMQALKK